MTGQETATLFSGARPLLLENGGALTGIRVAFERYGPPDPHGDNTIFVCHALTGDAHVARHHPGDRPGWWDVMVGPGRPVDTDIHQVVCANVLGGCAGTTGPCAPGPGSRPFGAGFPVVTIADMVTVHRELLAHLGLSRLFAVIGGSLGAMQALHWLLRAPGDARRFVLIAGTARLSADNLAHNAIARAAIRADPDFAGGHYPPGGGPRSGLGLARMVAHLTYLSRAALDAKCGRDQRPPGERPWRPSVATGPFAVERYLEHQADKLVARFDANSYLYLTAAMDQFDAFADALPDFRAADAARPAVSVFSFASDRLFGLDHSLAVAGRLHAAGLPVTHHHDLSSPAGHDAFLLDTPDYLREVARMLRPATAPVPAAVPETPVPTRS